MKFGIVTQASAVTFDTMVHTHVATLTENSTPRAFAEIVITKNIIKRAPIRIKIEQELAFMTLWISKSLNINS